MVDDSIDFRILGFRYPSSKVNRLARNLISRCKKGSLILLYPEYLFTGYPKSRNVLKEMFIEVKQYPCVIITSNKEVFDYFVKIGYSSYIVSELSMEELFPNREGRINPEVIDVSEGNLGVLHLLLEDKLEEAFNVLAEKFSSLESGQRYLLYYLSTHLGIGGLTKMLGAQTYVYLERLMKKGEVLRLGGRRGNYLVRNPLLRVFLNRHLRRDKPDWWVSGYLYLILKMLFSIEKETSIITLTRSLYMSPLSKMKRVDRSRVRLLDKTRATYTIYFSYDEEVPAINRIYTFENDVRILIYPYSPDPNLVRRLKRGNVALFDVSTLSRLSEALGFPRKI